MRKFLLICITVALSGATFAQKGLTAQDTRGGKLFDELGISLALAGNNHIYESTHPVYDEGNEKKDDSHTAQPQWRCFRYHRSVAL